MRKKGQYISKKKRQNSENNNTDKKISEKKQIQPKKQIVLSQKYTKQTKYIALIVVALATFAVFIPTFQNELTNWDDKEYVIDNPMLKTFDGQTIKRIFGSENLKERYWMGNYHPLTMLTLNLNYQMTGETDDGKIVVWSFQLTNILLHVLATIFLFLAILKLFDNLTIAFVTALLFGLHTLHVESVTWVSERKDVLYTAFYMMSLLFYATYAKTEKISNLIVAFILFVLSLLSKGQAVSLAPTLIAVDYLTKRKLLSPKVIIEKIPFFLLGILFGYIAINAQKAGYAIQDVSHYAFYKRIAVAGYGFSQYIIKLFAPLNLSAIYPYPDILNKTIPAFYWLGLIPTGIVAFLAVYFFNKNRTITFAIAFFVLNILLLLQLIPVGSAIYADRYAYIPSVGFFLVFGYLADLFSRKKVKNLEFLSSGFNVGKLKLNTFHFIIIFYAIFISATTVQRQSVWKNSLALWNDVVKKQPKAVVAHNNRGSEFNVVAKEAKDNYDYETYKDYKLRAIQSFTEAIERKPDYQNAFYNRGASKKELGTEFGDTTLVLEAIKDFDKAIAIDLEFIEAYLERGSAYDFLGQYQKAIDDYNRGIKLAPENTQNIINKGVTLGKMGEFKQSIETFTQAIIIEPENSSAYGNRGLARDLAGDTLGALQDFNKSIELDPTSYKTFFNRALTKRKLNDIEGAITDLTKVIELKNDNGSAYYLRGEYFLLINKPQDACNDFKMAAQFNTPRANKMLQKYCQ